MSRRTSSHRHLFTQRAPTRALNAPSVIDPSSVKTRPRPCVRTTEEESGLRGDLREYPTNIDVHAQTNEKEEGRVHADPSREAGWNHHFTKHTKPFVAFARSRLKNTSALGPAVHDSEGMCQSKAGHGIFSTTRADGD